MKRSRPKRNRQIIFRLTEHEFTAFEKIARKAGLTPNELARSFARTADGRVTVKVTRRLDPRYISQLKRMGNNLNQVARNSNIYGKVPPEVEALCVEIKEIILMSLKEQLE